MGIKVVTVAMVTSQLGYKDSHLLERCADVLYYGCYLKAEISKIILNIGICVLICYMGLA